MRVSALMGTEEHLGVCWTAPKAPSAECESPSNVVTGATLEA